MIKSNLIHFSKNVRGLNSLTYLILANETEVKNYFLFSLLFSYSSLKKSHYNTDKAAQNLYPRNLLVNLYYKTKQTAPSNPSFCCSNHGLSVLLCHWLKRNISNHPKRIFLKSWLVIFGEFPINCWIGYWVVLSAQWHCCSSFC